MKKAIAIMTFVLFALSPLTVAAKQPKDKKTDDSAYEQGSDEAGAQKEERHPSEIKARKAEQEKEKREKGGKKADSVQGGEKSAGNGSGPDEKAYEHAGDKASFKRGESSDAGMKPRDGEQMKDRKGKKGSKEETDAEKGKKTVKKEKGTNDPKKPREHEMKKKEGAEMHRKMEKQKHSEEEKTEE